MKDGQKVPIFVNVAQAMVILPNITIFVTCILRMIQLHAKCDCNVCNVAPILTAEHVNSNWNMDGARIRGTFIVALVPEKS